MPIGKLSIVLSRQAEIYIDRNPLDWVYQPTCARYDRKRSWLVYDLPSGTRLDLYDGFGVYHLIVNDTACQNLRFHAARIEGSVECA